MSTSLSNDEGTIDDIVVLPSPQDPPPDGGYGWVCVGACFCINGFVWGEVAVIHFPNYSKSSPSQELTFPVLWRLPLLLSLKQHIPHCHPKRLCLHRRLQFLHGYASRPLRNNYYSKIRTSSAYAFRSRLPRCKPHLRVFLS